MSFFNTMEYLFSSSVEYMDNTRAVQPKHGQASLNLTQPTAEHDWFYTSDSLDSSPTPYYDDFISPLCSSPLPSNSSSSHPPSIPNRVSHHTIKVFLENDFTLGYLLQSISSSLEAQCEYDFTFFPDQFLWKGKYFQGGLSCIIHLQVFRENNIPNLFLLELSKIDGDSQPYITFYHYLQNVFHTSSRKTSGKFNPSSDSSKGYSSIPRQFSMSMLPQEETFITEDSIRNSMKIISQMYSSGFIDCQIQASKILYDLISISQYSLSQIDRNIIFELFSLVENCFLQSSPEYLGGSLTSSREYVVLCLSQLLDELDYEPKGLNPQIVKYCLRMISNPTESPKSYITAQLRRECAMIILRLQILDPHSLMKRLEGLSFSLSSWITSVTQIKDMRLQLTANRIVDQMKKYQHAHQQLNNGLQG